MTKQEREYNAGPDRERNLEPECSKERRNHRADADWRAPQRRSSKKEQRCNRAQSDSRQQDSDKREDEQVTHEGLTCYRAQIRAFSRGDAL